MLRGRQGLAAVRPSAVFGIAVRLLLPILALGLAPAIAGAQQTTIAIATSGTGGVYHPLGVGMAVVLNRHLPDVAAVARVTGGSVDNLKLVGARQIDIGLTMVDAALDALRGHGKFKGGKLDLRTLMVLYPNRMHAVTLEDRGINTLADLKGRRVSTGSPGSATEVMALRVVEAAGLQLDKDLKRERLALSEAVLALREGRIDAFFWAGGLPSPAISELADMAGPKIKLLNTAEVVDTLNKKHGGIYSAGTIPAKAYPNQDKDVAVALVQNILVTEASLPEDLAYKVVKTCIERRAELIAVHGEAQSITLENQAAKNTPIPWHPGAVRFFREKGIAM